MKGVSILGDNRRKAAPIEEKWARLEQLIKMNFSDHETGPLCQLQFERDLPAALSAEHLLENGLKMENQDVSA